jgi:hypothetical protein
MFRISKLALLISGALAATGCVAAAAGAGAAGAVYLTSRGAESLVNSPPDDVARRAEAVMREEAIVKDAESTEKSGSKRELKGKKGDLDVSIEIQEQTTNPATTKVEVSARKNEVEWDKDYAQQILNKIVAKE